MTAWLARRWRWLTLAGVALALALLAFVRGDHFVRTQTRLILERELGALLQGELHVDRIAELTLGHVVAEGVTMLDPQKRAVLHAKRLRLDLDLSELPSGIRFSRGHLTDARIRSIPSDAAGISLFEAFLPRTTPGEPPSTGEPFRITFDGIRIERAALYGDLPGFPGVRAENVAVDARIAVAKGLDVRVARVSGRFTAPFAQPVTIDQAATNIVLADGMLRITARAGLARGTERLSARLGYTLKLDARDALDLRLDLAPVSPEWVREFGLPLPQTLYGELRGPVRLTGPRDHLHFDVSAETSGGPLWIRGELPTGGTSLVHVESPRLSLPEVLAYAPPVSLGVQVDVSAPPDGPVKVTGSAPFVEVMGVTATDATLQGEYANGVFTIGKARLSYAGGQFGVEGWVDENADLALLLRSELPDTRREPTLRQAGFRAAVRSDLKITRKGDSMSLAGSLALRDAAYEGITARTLVLEGRFGVDDGDFTKPTARLRGSASELAIPGLVAGAVTFALDGRAGRYVSDLAIEDPRGRSLKARAAFTQLARGWRIQADPLTLAVKDRDPWRAQADVVVHDQGIELHKVLLASGPQRLELSGSYSYSQAYGVDAVLQAFDIGGLRELLDLPLADLDGTVDGQLHLTGVPGHPRIDAQGSLRGGVFLGMEDLTVLLSLVFVERRFDVECEVQLPDASRLAIYAGGEPGPGPTWGTQIERGNYQFGLDFEQVPFEVARPWLAWLGVEPPGGKLSVMMRGAGTFAAPVLELTSRVDGLTLSDFPPIDIDLALAHDATTLQVERLEVADAHGRLASLNGSLAAELAELPDVAALQRSLDVRPFDLALQVPPRRLDQLPGFLRMDAPLWASAELRAAQGAGGPSLEASTRLGWPKDEPGVDACGLVRHPELHMLVRAQGSSAQLEATAMVDDEVVAWFDAGAAPDFAAWLTGREPPHVLPTRLNARLNAASTEELPWLCEYVAGPLRAEVAADDVFATPPELRFTLDSGSLQLVPHASTGQRLGNLHAARTVGRAFALHASGGVEQRRVAFVAQVDQGKGSALEVFGSVPRAAFLPPELRKEDLEPLEARVRATRFQLSPVLLALPIDARVAGLLQGDVRVAYDLTAEKLSLEGALDLSDGQVAITALGQELSDLSASLRMSGDTLRFTDLEAHDFDGKLSAEGEVVFGSLDLVRADLTLRVEDFPLRREGIQVSKVTGEMSLKAELSPERTRADLDLSGIRVDLPRELDTSLQPLDPHPDIAVKGEEPPEAAEAPYLVEMRVHANPPFRVRRTDLSADVLADVTLRYRAPELSLQGSAELKRGSFELYGKRFELEESRLAFDGGDELDPLVSLYAIHKIGGDEIGVRVEGRLSAPIVTFSHSNPAITDTGEIIAQLLGARRDDTASSSQDATGAAANFLAGATAGLLTQEVRNRFGGTLPVFSIESGNQAFRNARIRAGVQLDTFLEKRLGPLRHVVRGAYIEGFVSPGAGTDSETRSQSTVPQSRGGGLLELRFPRDFVGTVEYRPVQNWRLDVAWEP